MVYDILIKNGVYPDFEADRLVKGDIAIADGKIAAVGQVEGDAKKVIDAAGRVVSPGFIDIHMHEESFLKEGKEYVISRMMLLMGVTTCLGGNCGKSRQSLDMFKNVIKELGGAPVNYLIQAGYNSARNAMGIGRYDAAAPEQIAMLAQQMKDDIDHGAYGISFGLEYDPGITFEEVMQVLNAQPQEDLYVSMHYRDDSSGSADAISEMIRIARESGKKFQISHLSSCSAMGQMADAIAVINQAMKENPKLNYDTYPYNAFSTGIGTAVFDDGCFEKWGKGYEDLLMTSGKYKNQFCTKETFEEMRRDDPDLRVVAFVMNEEEIAAAIANTEGGMIGSDGGVERKAGHPRSAGTFPRVLGKYVREEKCISLLDALRKMTIAPADRLELAGKGRIAVGCDGDITVFNPDTIADGATFENLYIPPVGIDFVIVDGKVAVDHNEIIDERAGTFISGPFEKK